jgi:hypothetical protein
MAGVLLVFTASCAHQVVSRRTVAKATPQGEVEISMGSEDGLTVGDQVAFFTNKCTHPQQTTAKHGMDSSCERANLGQGTVVRLIEKAHAIVRIESGKNFETGTFVEKMD